MKKASRPIDSPFLLPDAHSLCLHRLFLFLEQRPGLSLLLIEQISIDPWLGPRALESRLMRQTSQLVPEVPRVQPPRQLHRLLERVEEGSRRYCQLEPGRRRLAR